jgi:hypothetical protein
MLNEEEILKLIQRASGTSSAKKDSLKRMSTSIQQMREQVSKLTMNTPNLHQPKEKDTSSEELERKSIRKNTSSPLRALPIFY